MSQATDREDQKIKRWHVA